MYQLHGQGAKAAQEYLVQVWGEAEARFRIYAACGTGAHLVEMQRWYTVEGVDLSPAMLAVARTRLPDVPLREADMRTLDLGKTFDAVSCLFSSIGYMTDLESCGPLSRDSRRTLRRGES